MNDVEKRSAQTPSVDPFASFRNEMDRMLESFFGARPFGAAGLPAGGAVSGALAPTVDVTENDDAIIIAAELPGMSEEDVELSIQNGVLTLSGEKRFEQSSDKDQIHTVERRYGAIRRSFRLPDSVDAEKAAASFDKGVLKVTLPKKPEAAAQARRIEISRS